MADTVTARKFLRNLQKQNIGCKCELSRIKGSHGEEMDGKSPQSISHLSLSDWVHICIAR